MTLSRYESDAPIRREQGTPAVRPGRHSLAVRRARAGEQDFVPHLRLEEVQELARHAQLSARKGMGEQDTLLIQTLFDGYFRVSEAVCLTPASLVQTPHGWVARITGKELLLLVGLKGHES
jgi:hypothetical protein